VGYRIAGRLQRLDQPGFALGRVGVHFKLAGGGLADKIKGMAGGGFNS